MKKVRIIASFLLISVLALPFLNQIGSLYFGGSISVFLPGNYLFYFAILALSTVIHPKINKKIKVISTAYLAVALIVFTSMAAFEFSEIKRLPNKIESAGGYSRLIYGDRITEKSDIEFVCDCLSSGTTKIDWKESLWFLYHGAHSCTCGRGEILTLNDGSKVFHIKHGGDFQQFGFVSIHSSGWEDYSLKIQELNSSKKETISHNKAVERNSYSLRS